MTNEELATLVKSGDSAATGQLWEQVKGLIILQVNSFYTRAYESCIATGVTVDDLEQEAFLALLDAVAAWNPDSECKLTTYLKYPLKNRFNAIIGIRQRKREPMNLATSIEELIPGSEDITIQDTIPDPAAESAFSDAEHRLFITGLRKALDTAIDTLSPQKGMVIREKHFHGRKLKDIAADIGLSYSRCNTIEHQALRRLRGIKRLEGYKDEVIDRFAYRGSLASFRHTFTSSTERAVLELMK